MAAAVVVPMVAHSPNHRVKTVIEATVVDLVQAVVEMVNHFAMQRERTYPLHDLQLLAR